MGRGTPSVGSIALWAKRKKDNLAQALLSLGSSDYGWCDTMPQAPAVMISPPVWVAPCEPKESLPGLGGFCKVFYHHNDKSNTPGLLLF